MPLKLMFVIPTLRYGGAELFLYRLCKEIHLRYEVVIVAIGNKEGLFEDFAKLNLRIYCLGFVKVTSFPRALYRLRNLIKMEQPNVIQSFLYMADILSSFAAVGLKVKNLIWTLRGTKLARGTSLHKILMQRFGSLFSRAIPTNIVACSNQVKFYHESIGYPQDKIVCIGNILPQWTRAQSRNSVFLREQFPLCFTIGLAARFEPGKGHLDLLNGVAEFLVQRKDVCINIKLAGKGCNSSDEFWLQLSKMKNLHKQVEESRLRIELLGLVRQDHMRAWFESIDLYYMASDSLEGFPNSLAEAIALGVPSLANPVGAAIDFLPSSRIAHGLGPLSIMNNLSAFYFEKLSQRSKTTLELRKTMLESFAAPKVLKEYELLWQQDL